MTKIPNMVNCAVTGCYNHSKKCIKLGQNIKFYRFPKDVELCDKWIKACGRPTIDLNMASICSVHFQPSVFLNPLRFQIMKSVPKNFRNIKDDAVPTEKLPKPIEDTKIIQKGNQELSKRKVRKGVKEKRSKSSECSENGDNPTSIDMDEPSSPDAPLLTTVQTPSPTLAVKEDMDIDLDNMEIFVATSQEDKVWAVKEAFKTVFDKATVMGVPTQNLSTANQPVGLSAALTQAKDKISQVRSGVSWHETRNFMPILAIESYIIQSEHDKWYEMSLLVLSHPSLNINLQTLTQCTPVPGDAVEAARNDTAQDYTHADTGYSNTIDQYMPEKQHGSKKKKSAITVTRRDLTLIATRSLAEMYKNILHSKSKKK